MPRPKRPRILAEDLTVEILREWLAYDADTGVFTWKQPTANSCVVGSVAGNLLRGYVRIRLFHSQHFAHRLAWLYVHGRWPADMIDHIDGNPSNNAIANLREATSFQNQHNRPSRGYAWDKRERRYSAALRSNGKSIWLGYFDTAAEARSAYLAAHAKHNGCYSFTARRVAGGQVLDTNASHLSAPVSPSGGVR